METNYASDYLTVYMLLVVCFVQLWWKMVIITILITMLFMLPMLHKLLTVSCWKERSVLVCVFIYSYAHLFSSLLYYFMLMVFQADKPSIINVA